MEIINSRIIVAAAIALIGWFGNETLVRFTVERNAELEEVKTQIENNFVAGKLKAEIDYRATRIEAYLKDVIIYTISNDSLKVEKAISDLIMAIGPVTNDRHAYMFSEYSNLNLASLLSRLTLLSKSDSGMLEILNDAMKSAKELQSLSADTHSYNSKTTVSVVIKRTLEQLKSLSVVTGKSYLAGLNTLINNMRK